MSINQILKSVLAIAVLGGIPVLQSCNKDDAQPANANDYVNSWIISNMKEAYYWTDKLPASPNKNLDPESFLSLSLTNQTIVFLDTRKLSAIAQFASRD